MKLRSDFISNSSSCSFIVDSDTNERYKEKYGASELDCEYIEFNGKSCVEYCGYDADEGYPGYENAEEYLKDMYNKMADLDPKILEFYNNH